MLTGSKIRDDMFIKLCDEHSNAALKVKWRVDRMLNHACLQTLSHILTVNMRVRRWLR